MLLYKYLPLSWSEEPSAQEERLNYSRCLCLLVLNTKNVE